MGGRGGVGVVAGPLRDTNLPGTVFLARGFGWFVVAVRALGDQLAIMFSRELLLSCDGPAASGPILSTRDYGTKTKSTNIE